MKWRAEEKNKKALPNRQKRVKKQKRILHWYYYSDIMVYHCDVRRFFILFIRCVLIIASLLNFVSSSIQPLERPILWLIWLCCGFLSLSLSFSLSLQYVFGYRSVKFCLFAALAIFVQSSNIRHFFLHYY